MNWLMWALFGNDLDGVDADSEQAKGWRPELTGWKRRVLWWLRNPFHNLLWHVLGVVDRSTQELASGWRRVGRYPLANVPPDGVRLHARVLLKPWRLPLPLIGWRAGKWEGYVGWRERGNLGFAVRRA